MTGLGEATDAGWVETVLGPVDPGVLGPTLLHEHGMDARPLLAAHGYAAAAAPAAPFDARTAAAA
jgi:predicted metal-dependent phosphotriesterase family hydrolase